MVIDKDELSGVTYRLGFVADFDSRTGAALSHWVDHGVAAFVEFGGTDLLEYRVRYGIDSELAWDD